MSDHFIDIRLNDGFVSVEWKCEADDTADCRNHCPDPECCEGCLNYLDHRRNWILNTDPTNNKSYCGKIIWLKEGGTWDEMYSGPDDTDVRSGPIEVVWHGSGYGWRYAQ